MEKKWGDTPSVTLSKIHNKYIHLEYNMDKLVLVLNKHFKD